MSIDNMDDAVNAAVHILKGQAFQHSDNAGIDFGAAFAELVFAVIMRIHIHNNFTEHERQLYCDRLRVLVTAQLHHGILKEG